MLVYDRQPNGALPAISDIILSQSQTSGSTSSTALDQLNLDKRDRFRVLMDERILTPAVIIDDTSGAIEQAWPTGQMPADQGGNNYNFKRHMKFLPALETQYQADSSPAVIGDIATGSLLFVTYGLFTSANSGWVLDASLRVRFVDQ